MDKTKVTKDMQAKTLTIERVFNSPKEKLWKAYASQEWFEQWWGPEGWQTTTKTFDFRPGGQIHYGMKCVDKNQVEWYGQESWGLMEIEDVNEDTSFSARDYFSDAEGAVNHDMPSQRFIVELAEQGDKTRLICRSITETEQQLEELVNMGMIEGFSSQLNKLESLLES